MTRLTLLGLLSSKPMHGYELRQQMRLWAMDDWVDIRPGSIYAALPRMTAEGLLEVVEVSQEGNRPARTVYGITAAGRVELTRLLGEAWARPAGMAQPIDVALFFMWILPGEDVAERLEERLDTLATAQEGLARNHAMWAGMTAAAAVDVPTQYFEMMEDLFDHSARLLETERGWSERMLERVRGGVFSFDEPATDGRKSDKRKAEQRARK